jgi:hypothetical protein
MQACLGTRSSQTWRAVLEGRDAMKLGLIKRIGNGADTNILHGNWIPRDSRLLPIVALKPDSPTLVPELIDQSMGTWNIGKLNQNFLPMDIDVIKSIPICTAPVTDS